MPTLQEGLVGELDQEQERRSLNMRKVYSQLSEEERRKRRPPPPDVLVGALQDAIEIRRAGNARAAKAARSPRP